MEGMGPKELSVHKWRSYLKVSWCPNSQSTQMLAGAFPLTEAGNIPLTWMTARLSEQVIKPIQIVSVWALHCFWSTIHLILGKEPSPCICLNWLWFCSVQYSRTPPSLPTSHMLAQTSSRSDTEETPSFFEGRVKSDSSGGVAWMKRKSLSLCSRNFQTDYMSE